MLLIVETLQFISFAFDQKLDFFWKNRSLRLIFRIFDFFGLENALNQGNVKNNVNKLYVVTAVNFMILGISVVILVCRGSERESRTNLKKTSAALSSFCSKLCGFLLMLHRTVLTYPAFQCISSFLICGGGSPYLKEGDSFSCYSSSHIGHLVLGVANLIFSLGVMVFNFVLINDFSPGSVIPFAGFYNKNWIFEFSMKFFIPLMSIVDFNVSEKPLFSILSSLSNGEKRLQNCNFPLELHFSY